MIVDSSALAEQVVADVIASAFDSAGQRCSALRILCLQEDVADRILAMLKGALHELSIGRTDALSADVGPVITAEAKGSIDRHIEAMRRSGHAVEQIARAGETGSGTFVRPTIIELDSLRDLQREVFGPVLHVIRYPRAGLDQLIDDINATGYGLTFGLHTRLDETIAQVTGRIRAGNLYINRNIIGAVVGVQPFGGRGLSGTGPKAGGPLYLGRLVGDPRSLAHAQPGTPDPVLLDYAAWLDRRGAEADAEAAREAGRRSGLGRQSILGGPVGETNIHALHPRGRILLLPCTEKGLYDQLAAVLATGNDAVIQADRPLREVLSGAPAQLLERIEWIDALHHVDLCAGALIEGDAARVLGLQQDIAGLDGPILLTQSTDGQAAAGNPYCLDWLLEEVSTSINTTAAGGNASLMTIA